MAPRAHALLLVLAGLAACRPQGTEALSTISAADVVVPDDINALSVSVTDATSDLKLYERTLSLCPPGQRAPDGSPCYALPVSLTAVPGPTGEEHFVRL